MAQTVVPSLDVSAGVWTPTPIYAEIDNYDPLNHWVTTGALGAGSYSFETGLTNFDWPQAGTYQITVKYAGNITSGLGVDHGTLTVTIVSGVGLPDISFSVTLPDLFAIPATHTYTLSAADIDALLITMGHALGTSAPGSGNNGVTAFAPTLRVTVDIPTGITQEAFIYYVELSVPDVFSQSMTPSSGPKAGGTSVTLVSRYVGKVAVNPADLRIQFANDYNEVTPSVVDDDTITITTPANSADTPGTLTGAWIPVLFLYDVSDPSNRQMSLTYASPAYTTPIWTYSEFVAPSLSIDETEAVGALNVTVPFGTGGTGGRSGFSASVIDGEGAEFAFNALVLWPDDGSALGAIKIGGQTEFEFFSPSTPTAQNGGQWRLHQFMFKYRQEEIS